MSELNQNHEADRLSTPSKVDEGAPSLARNIGLAGCLVFAVGLLLWLWNVFAFPYGMDEINRVPKRPPATWGWVSLWILVGSLALVLHAYRDRDQSIRRAYAFFGLALVSFGALWLAYAFTAEGMRMLRVGESADPEVLQAALSLAKWTAVAVTGVLALFIAAFALAPFLAAVSEAKDEKPLTPLNFVPRLIANFRGDVQTLTIGLAAMQAVLVIVIAILFNQLRDVLKDQSKELFSASDFNLLVFGLLPYGIWSLFFGLLFLLLHQSSEDEQPWRLSGVYVLGWIGALLALVGMMCGLGDLIKLPDLMMPYGLLLGALAFPLLWAYLKNLPADGELAYGSAWWLRALGLVAACYALGRCLYPVLAEQFWDSETALPFLVPNGFLMIALGLAFAWLGHSYAGEDRLTALVNRELTSYFSSPIAYVVVGGMAIIAWIAFFAWLTERLVNTRGAPIPEPVILEYLFGLWPVIGLLIAVPMLTMRLLSEEQRAGTMEVLLTAPVDETQIVLSKFFSSWIMFMVCWSPWFLFPLAYRAVTADSFDYRPLLSSFAGMGLMASAFLALGLFFSALTRNQIIAFLLALGGMLLMFSPALLSSREMSPATRELVMLSSFLFHMVEFGRGLVHLKFVVFYLAFTIFWLFLTVKVLEARKWK